MKIQSACSDIIHSCEATHTYALGHLYHDDKPMAVHIHDSYEVYYSVSGGKQFLIDNRFYDIHPGDLFFVNQFESHHITKCDNLTHERIVLSIYPEYLTQCSTNKTDLNYCFTHRTKEQGHKISLSSEEQKRFMYYVHKLSATDGFGEDILEPAIFLEMMVYLNKIFMEHEQNPSAIPDSNLPDSSETGISHHQHEQVDEILTYINQHIHEELSIQALSDHFYLSSSYLCRIFKSATGTTINRYVTAKRIANAKSLLAEGHTVGEVCHMVGFNDYSNFLKAFTKAVGVSPKKYSQFSA